MMQTRKVHMNFRRAFGILAMALLLVVVTASLVFAEEVRPPLHLRSQITTQSDAITFGDVFSNAGDLAQTRLGDAPRPGHRLALDPTWLSARARENGAQWNNLSGLKRVIVQRAGTQMDRMQIASLIADELHARNGGDYAVLVSAISSGIYLDTGSMQTAFVDGLNMDPATGQISAQISTGDGMPVTVRARAWAKRQVPVLAHAISRGETVTADDITWASMRSDRLGASAVTDENELVGKEAKRNLQPGVLLREHDVATPIAVNKGEMITIAYEVPGLKLTARGKVLENAAIGDTVRAVNLHSNRTIQVTITAPGQALAVPAQGVDG